jgi:hypothetical protein
MVTALDDLIARKKQARADKRAQEAIDRRVERAFYTSCSGIQLDIMDIQKVFQIGRNAVLDQLDDAELANVIRRYVDTIRKN